MIIKEIFVYHCIVANKQLYLTCCVSERLDEIKFSRKDSKVSHIIKVIKLFLFREKGVSPIRLKINDEVFSFKTNKYSFLTVFEKTKAPIESISIALEKGEYKSLSFQNTLENERILISDIDDTILKSHATNYVKLMFKTLFKQLSKRDSFSNTASFYQELAKNNKVIYLSNSTWNIYPLVKAFLSEFDFPLGHIILHNLKDKNIPHKENALHKIATLYPRAVFTLIGDEGQHDLAFYFNFAKKYPNQINSILIRKVWWKSKEEEEKYADLARELGINLAYFNEVSELRENGALQIIPQETHQS